MKLLIISLAFFLSACGGGGSDVSAKKTKVIKKERISCLSNYRNCDDADVDLNAPVRWAADNGIPIVHIRWAKCSDEESSKYAFERGVTIICIAPSNGERMVNNSPYTIMGGTDGGNSNYGPGIDYVLKTKSKGTIHAGIRALALAATDQPLTWKPKCGDLCFGYPEPKWESDKTVLIVDNGFDSVRPLYVLYKNTALAGLTGDYGIKALNELGRYVDVDVIGYVPFNTKPPNPRYDDWEIL